MMDSADAVAGQGRAAARWEVQLLGTPELRYGERRVRLERRAAAVLATLVLGGTVGKRALAALLWPDTRDGQLLNNLRQLLRRLRLACPGAPVLVQGESRDELLLDPTAHVDVVALRKGTAPERVEALLATQGELLAGLSFDDLPEFSHWLDGARMEVAGAQRKLLRAELARRERAADLAGALPLAEAWLRAEPESDEAVRAVMRLHCELGARRTALEIYDRHRACLARELGVSPSPEVAALAQRIRAAVRPAAPQPESEREDGRRPAPELERLVGRELAWAQLEHAWRRDARVMCIHGPPGIGKSRLATELVDGMGRSLLLEGRSGDVGVPYATLVRTLRRSLAQLQEAPLPTWARRELAQLLPELGEDAPGRRKAAWDGPRVRRLHALALAVDAAAEGCAALLAEDLDTWDVESREVLRHWLADAASSGRPPVVVTWGAFGSVEAMQALGADVLMEAACVEVGPWSYADVETLVRCRVAPEDAGTLALQVWELAGGNPRLVLEALREHAAGWAEAGLERVRTLARAQVHRLHPRAKEVLEALRTDPATPAVLGALAGATQLPLLDVVSAVEQLRRAGLVVTGGPGEGTACGAVRVSRREGAHLHGLVPVVAVPRAVFEGVGVLRSA